MAFYLPVRRYKEHKLSVAPWPGLLQIVEQGAIDDNKR